MSFRFAGPMCVVLGLVQMPCAAAGEESSTPAADDPAPSEELLEFLGSVDSVEQDEDWFAWLLETEMPAKTEVKKDE